MDYNQQAVDFLRDTHTHLFIERAVPQKSPRWAKDGKHGTCYSVTLAKMKGNVRASKDIAGLREEYNSIEKSVQFFFWNSLKAKEEGKNSYAGEKKPQAYDILAGLYMPVADFSDFCASFGYDEDSRNALATYEEVKELNEKLGSIYSGQELERLGEIV